MSRARISQAFYWNFFFLWMFGVWPGKHSNRLYKIYSVIILTLSLIIYNTLLTINLFYTPHKIEFLIQEFVFYFTEFGITWKAFTMIVLRENVIEILNIIDSEMLTGEDDNARNTIEKDKRFYVLYYKFFALISNVAYGFLVTVPLILHFIFNKDIDLPLCRYYLLSEEFRSKYFFYIFTYQAIGLYIGMMLNICIDTLIPGFILIAVTQLKILNYRLRNLGVDTKKVNKKRNDDSEISKLNNCLKHYEEILRYCNKVQSLLSLIILIQFGVSCFVICIMLSTVLFETSDQIVVFMVFYAGAILLEIFTPSYMGTQVTYESSRLSHAAYCSAWRDRSPRFKRHLTLFMERAKRPILISGVGLFPLSLETFTSICKTAYSFFALVRNVQMRQNAL